MLVALMLAALWGAGVWIGHANGYLPALDRVERLHAGRERPLVRAARLDRTGACDGGGAAAGRGGLRGGETLRVGSADRWEALALPIPNRGWAG